MQSNLATSKTSTATTVYVPCLCTSSDHLLAFTMYEPIIGEDFDEMYVSAYWNVSLPWYRRCWLALTYIFFPAKAEAMIGDTLLNKDAVQHLNSLFSEWLAKCDAKASSGPTRPVMPPSRTVKEWESPTEQSSPPNHH